MARKLPGIPLLVLPLVLLLAGPAASADLPDFSAPPDVARRHEVMQELHLSLRSQGEAARGQALAARFNEALVQSVTQGGQ